MALRLLLTALCSDAVLTSGSCPADFVSQTVDGLGDVENSEDAATLDLYLSMIQVSVTRHYHRRGLNLLQMNSSLTKGPMPQMNATDSVHQVPLTSTKKETSLDAVISTNGTDCLGFSSCQQKAATASKGMKPNMQILDKQVDNRSGIEVSTHSGPITVHSKKQQQQEQQELALFIESLAEEGVHDLVGKIHSALDSMWKLPWMAFSSFFLPSNYIRGQYLSGDPRLWSFVAYAEILLVCIVAIVSLSQQRKRWQLPHLQTAEVHLVLSLVVLAVFARIIAHPSWCLAFTLGLRYFVEGYMLFIALYILPSTLGRCMAEAQVREQQRAAEYFVMEGGGFESDSHQTTPPLLDVAIKQQEIQPEISPFPTSLPPMPVLLTVLLCVLRPLLGVSCALAEHRLAMPICFWLNTWLVLAGLVLTAGLVRDTFSQIAQYVPTCELVALSVGLLPLLGGLQDVGLCGSLNPEAISYAGVLYLHEVTAMTLFVIYMISQGAHFPTDKILYVAPDHTDEVAGWQCWLQEVLVNPYSMLKALKANRCPDVENTVNEKRQKPDDLHNERAPGFLIICSSHDAA